VHCRDHAVQLHRARERFEQAGLGIVLIGQATPRHAAHFRRKVGLEDIPVLADEERATYRLAGLRRGNVAQLVGPRSVLSGIKHSARSGVVHGKVIGDATQLGGAAIIAPGGELIFQHASKDAGDTVEPDDLLAAATPAG
jgi:hypothetical protein